MREEKKRLPWWLAAGALVLAILGTALGFIETVGRRGTLVGRYEHIKDGMPRSEVHRIFGTPSESHTEGWLVDVWRERSAFVIVEFRHNAVSSKFAWMDPAEVRDHRLWWNIHRSAEQAWTAIHGPRR